MQPATAIIKMISINAIFIIALSGTLHSYPISTRDILLVDNFNEMSKKNKLGGTVGAWKSDPDDASQWCEISFDNKNFVGQTGASMKIDYNIDSNKTTYIEDQKTVSPYERGFHGLAFNGIYMQLNNLDISSYKYLVFSAKGEKETGFSRRFKIEIQDKSRTAAVIFDKLTSKWEKFLIPLSQFSSIIDLKETQAIVLVFDTNMIRNRGIMYVDDIFFAKSKNADLYRSADSIAHAHRGRKPVKVDGKIDEWNKVGSFELNDKKNLESGLVQDEDDLSAKVYFQWDEHYLYFAVRVRDEDIVCMTTGKEIYKFDSVELFLDPANDGLTWKNPSDYQIGFSPTSPFGTHQIWSWFQDRHPSIREVNFSARLVKDGYEIESAISWNFLNLTPTDGMSINVSVSVHDIDKVQFPDDTREAKLNWYFVKDEKMKDRFMLGSLLLVGHN